MRHPRFIEISLLFSLASFGCEGGADRDDPEEEFDMSLLEQDDEGEWYAPINEDAPTDLATPDDPAATFFPMHNHLVDIDGGVSQWSIHRNGGHGTVCGFKSDFIEQCFNIALYLGGSFYFPHGYVYCGGGFVKNATCAVW